MFTTLLAAAVVAATLFQVGYTVRLAVPLVRARAARRKSLNDVIRAA